MIKQKEKFYLTEYQKTLIIEGKRINKNPNIIHYRKNGKTEIVTELLLARLKGSLAEI